VSGTRVTCEDIATGESESKTIENDWMVITDGRYYLDGIVTHANGTVQLTLKMKAAADV
jgi:hypothetical protein